MSVYRFRDEFRRRLQFARLVVVGFGVTGKSVARSLKTLGLKPWVVDTREESDLGGLLEEVGQLGLPLSCGAEARRVVEEGDLIIVSPGVDLQSEFLKGLCKGTEVISEIELAYRLAPCRIVAITGTNGKSTTTRLVGEILSEGGKEVVVGGNIGEPLIEKALSVPPTALLVAEVSSFQLEGTRFFRPRVGLILNITPDHSDRHGSFEEYASLKGRLIQAQRRGDVAIANLDDAIARGMVEEGAGKKYYFSRQPHERAGTFIEEGRVWWQEKGEKREVCRTDAWTLPGVHNEENVLAAITAGRVLRVRKERIAAAIEGFTLSEHTLEEVGVFGGLSYVNDSKGTNPAATIRALEAVAGRLVLIAGGSDKGLAFEPLLEPMKKKVRCLVVLGETGGVLRRLGEKAGVERICEASGLEEAVRLASRLGQPGETVLFSPAAASFGMFHDYKERGEAFKEAVRRVGK